MVKTATEYPYPVGQAHVDLFQALRVEGMEKDLALLQVCDRLIDDNRLAKDVCPILDNDGVWLGHRIRATRVEQTRTGAFLFVEVQ